MKRASCVMLSVEQLYNAVAACNG